VASVPGTYQYFPSIGAVLSAGYQTLNVTFTPADLENYSVVSANTTVHVTIGLPAVALPVAARVSGMGAALGGTVSSDGGASIIERGVVYALAAENTDPMLGGLGVAKIVAGGQTGAFLVAVNGLLAGSRYQYRAYAINSQGVSYSGVASFGTLSADAYLSALALGGTPIKPDFSSGKTEYSSIVSNAVNSITVNAVAAHLEATIQLRINSGSFSRLTSGISSGVLALNVGVNSV